MNIQVLNYSAGPFDNDFDLWEKVNDKEEMSFDIRSRLRYSPDKEVCGFQFDITLTLNDKMIVRCGLLFGLRIENLDKYIGDSLTKEVNNKSVAEISAFIWPYVVGALAARCADANIDMVLPPINYDKFAEEVMLIKAEPSRK